MELRTGIVLAVLRRKASPAEAAARSGATEAEIADWIRRFVEAGAAGLRRSGQWERGLDEPAAPEGSRAVAELLAENRTLRAALRETRGSALLWQAMAGGTLGPLRELEMIREDAAMPVSRFCHIVGIPRRSYFRRLARMRSGGDVAGRGAVAPSVQLCAPIIVPYLARWPEYGHRRIHALMLSDGHITSPSTVLRAMRLLRRSGRAVGADPVRDGERSASDPGAVKSAAHGDAVPAPPQV